MTVKEQEVSSQVRGRSTFLRGFVIGTATAASVAGLFFYGAIKPHPNTIDTGAASHESPTMETSPRRRKPEPQMLEQKKGKTLKFETTGPALTPEQISEFETEIGGRLPDDYKQFLLTQNGGLCDPRLGLPWAGSIETIFGFGSLSPLGKDSGIRLGLRHLRELNAKKVEGYVPITGTASGDWICIACRGSNVGKVFMTAYKYKIAYISDLVPTDVKMVPLVDSFSELLDYLVEIPDPYCPIEDLGENGTADTLAQYLAEGNSIDDLGKHDRTILCAAITFHNDAMVHLCIARGASLAHSIKNAVTVGSIHLIEMLLKAGANINERDEYGDTPLHYIGGTALPGEKGAQNRAMRDLLIKLGAVDENRSEPYEPID